MRPSSKPIDHLPGLSQDAKILVYKLFQGQTPTNEIIAQLAVEYRETIAPEIIDRARILWRPIYDDLLAQRNRAILATLASQGKPIEQTLIAAACELQADLYISLGLHLQQRLTDLDALESDKEKKQEFNQILGAAATLSTAIANIARAQILMARYAIELPYRAKQTSDDKPEKRKEITPEFVVEIEGMLGVLPYEQPDEAVADPLDASP